MKQVLRFAENNRTWQVLPEASARLLVELTKCLSFMWSGGWAEIGDNGQIVILHNQQAIGAWVHEDNGFSFIYHDEAAKRRYAAYVEDALRQSLMLVMQPSGR